MKFNEFPPDVQDHFIVHFNALELDHPDSQALVRQIKRWLRGQDDIPEFIELDYQGWPHPAYMHLWIEEESGILDG